RVGGVLWFVFFFFQAEDGIRDFHVTGVQTCALPICHRCARATYPEAPRAAASPPYLVLLPVGFAVPACCQARGALLPHHFTLARTLPSADDRAAGGIFLLHFPSARAAQALPGPVPCGARTFLGAFPGGRAPRLPGRLRRRPCRSAPAAALRPSGGTRRACLIAASHPLPERP